MLVPANRPEDRRPARRPKRRFWLLPRLRLLRTLEQFDREHQREDLRDRRWGRHQSMLLTGSLVVALVTGGIPLNEVITALTDQLLGLLGVP